MTLPPDLPLSLSPPCPVTKEFMEKLNALSLVIPFASVALTVGENGLPAVLLGVPLITPLLDMLIPAGRDPLEILQVRGSVPPTPTIACEYGILTVPAGRGLLVVMTGAELTTMVGFIEAWLLPPSVTLIVAEKLPAVVAVPMKDLVDPVPEQDSPGGIPVHVQVRVPAPQLLALNVVPGVCDTV